LLHLNVGVDKKGRGDMIKAPIDLQDLRRRLYVKAKTEPSWRFWGLYVHVCKRETLREAYRLAKANDGAPGIDGVTFESVEANGLEGFLEQLRQELIERTYRPERLRKVEIPKDGGKVRQLSIPTVTSQCTSIGRVSECFLVSDSAGVARPVPKVLFVGRV
jgi:retron-type reverse transcriptase